MLWDALPFGNDLVSAPPSTSWRVLASLVRELPWGWHHLRESKITHPDAFLPTCISPYSQLPPERLNLSPALLKCSKGVSLQHKVHTSPSAAANHSCKSLWSDKMWCTFQGCPDTGGCRVVAAWARSVAKFYVGSSTNTSGVFVPSWDLQSYISLVAVSHWTLYQ